MYISNLDQTILVEGWGKGRLHLMVSQRGVRV
jgi:hypothetical protein